uniref:Uncharacterized protein n=1 Tax=Arundo donax TaxID=35708 RepID=A0A0A9EJV0_ARUDO
MPGKKSKEVFLA